MKLVFNAIIAYFLIIHGQFATALEIGIANATHSGEYYNKQINKIFVL